MSYNAILPANVRHDKNLGDKAKLLYAEITAAFDDQGSCTKDNRALAELLGVHERTITRSLGELLEAGYISKSVSSSGLRTLFLPGTAKSESTKPIEEVEPTETIITLLRFWESQLGVTFTKADYTKYTKLYNERKKIFDDLDIIKAVQSRIAYLKTSEYHNRPENKESLREVDVVLGADAAVNQWIKLHDLK